MSDALIKKLNAITHCNLSDPMVVRMADWNEAMDEVRSVLDELSAAKTKAPKITPAMIEAGAQRLVRWDENSTWPDGWSALDVAAARQDAERVLRSALSVMGDDEHWAGTPEQEIETLREMVEQRDAEIERLRGRVDSLQEAQK